MQQFIKLIAKLIRKLPIHYQHTLFEIVLYNIPFWLLKKIPCSYSTYLKCYSPKKGDVILDCGAHVGNCAIIFSRLVGKTGLVISLEPFGQPFALLKDRLSRLKIENVLAINKGVWNQTIKMPVKVLTNTLYCRIDPEKDTKSSDDKLQIYCTTIDEVVEKLELPRLDMIKMDIEGAEIEALEGAAHTLKTFSPCLAVATYHSRDKKKTFHWVESYLNEKEYGTKTFFPPHLTTCAKYDCDNV